MPPRTRVSDSGLNVDKLHYHPYNTSEKCTLALAHDGTAGNAQLLSDAYGKNLLDYGMGTKCMPSAPVNGVFMP